MATETKKIMSTVHEYLNPQLLPLDYPHLMKDTKEDVFFMISPTKGVCLTNHHESYNGIQNLNAEYLENFTGILEIYNQH